MGNREILFRIWDKVRKEWLRYEKRRVGWYHPIMGEPKPIEMHIFVTKDNTEFLELQYCIDNPEHFTVQQFTGLRDKNGKRVFEGDKVRHKFKRMWQTELHESTVIWNQDFCCYYLFDGVINHRMRDDIEYEIIGNNFD